MTQSPSPPLAGGIGSADISDPQDRPDPQPARQRRHGIRRTETTQHCATESRDGHRSPIVDDHFGRWGYH